MSQVDYILKRAGRRQLLHDVLRWGSLGLAVGLSVGCLLLLIDRWQSWMLPNWIWWVPGVFGLIAGIGYAVWHAPSRQMLATRLDHGLDLHDQLSTANVLEQQASHENGLIFDPAFAALVQQKAEARARGLDIQRVTPIRLPITIIWVLLAAVLLGLGGKYLPTFSSFQQRENQARFAQRQAEEEENRQVLSEALTDVIDDLEQDPELAESAQQELDVLQALSDQLSGESADTVDSETARAQSMAELDELADTLAQQAERDGAIVEDLVRRFEGLPRDQEAGDLDDFIEALQRGDFDEAAEAWDKTLDQREQMGEEEQRALAEDLHRISERINELSQEQNQSTEQRKEQLQESLQDQGIDEETINEMMDDTEPDPDSLQRELEDRNIDEETIRDLQRELERLQKQRDIDEEVKKQLQDLSESMDPPTPPPDTSPPPQSKTPEPEEDLESTQTPSNTSEQQPQTTQSSEQSEQKQKPTTVPEHSERETSSQQTKEGAPTRKEKSERETGEQPRETTQTQPEVDPTQQPGQQAVPREIPDDQTGNGQQEQPRQPGEIMRELEQRRQGVQKNRRAQERVRDAMKELGDQRTEEQHRRWGTQSTESPPTRSPPFSESNQNQLPGTQPGQMQQGSESAQVEDLQDVDLRGEEKSDRVIAEWLDDLAEDGTPATPQTESTSPRVSQAQRVAERAVNETSVPARYHQIIQRYFDRLGETVRQASPPPPPTQSPTPPPSSPAGNKTESSKEASGDNKNTSTSEGDDS